MSHSDRDGDAPTMEELVEKARAKGPGASVDVMLKQDERIEELEAALAEARSAVRPAGDGREALLAAGYALRLVGGASVAWCVDHALPGVPVAGRFLAFIAIFAFYDGGNATLRRARGERRIPVAVAV